MTSILSFAEVGRPGACLRHRHAASVARLAQGLQE